LLGSLNSLYFRSFIPLHIPVFQGDSSPIFLMEVMKMLQGQFIYRDFFEFTLPGVQTVYLALLKLLGVRAWIPNALYVLLGLTLAWIGIRISRHLMDGAWAYLPSALFLSFAFESEPDPTHHWFSSLAAMAAVAVLMEKRSHVRIAAAGALCGLSALFTQNRGGGGLPLQPERRHPSTSRQIKLHPSPRLCTMEGDLPTLQRATILPFR
jgi:hypothetical protein